MNEVEQKIISLTNEECLIEAKKISDDVVLPSKTLTILGSDKILKYNITDEDENYIVELILKKDEIIGMHCTCFERDTKCCKHIAKVLLKNYKDFFPKLVNNSNKLINDINISNRILDNLYKEVVYKPGVKLELEVELSFVHNLGLFFDFRIGVNKLYVLGKKIDEFFKIFGEKNKELELGKKFIIKTNEHYFNEEDTRIIEFCKINYQTFGKNFISENMVDKFMNLLKNKKFYVNNSLVNGIKFSNPYNFSINYSNEYYELILNDELKYRYLDFDKNYCLKDGIVYKVPIEIKNLINEFLMNGVNSLIFSKKELNKFYKVFGKYLDSNIIISDNIKNEFITIEPKTKIYFDLNDEIICLVLFDYNDKEINYFSEDVSFLRNSDYETSVIKELTDIGFIIDDKNIYLKDNDLYVDLIEKYLPLLNKKYTVYTTEKFDKMNFKKKININSHFSIGMDNIFRYDFDLDGMDNKELGSLFNEMSSGKKYYRFKNGTIVDLEDEKLKELKNLTDELNLDYDLMENGKEYEIPKYRALYLDSLKEKSSIIETNNLFDEFVSNFKKNSSKFTNDDSVLRDYQVVGVNWLLNIYNYGFGGILADEMGLGKSIQVIYFLKELLKQNENFKFLIVSPTSLIYNWANEFEKFGKSIKYLVCAGTKINRSKLFKEVNNVNVLITSYGLVREDFETYLEKNFEVIIIDEAQNIKNPRAEVTKCLKKLNSNIKLALTGTPLENSVSELWSIFDFIMPGYLNSLKIFEEKYLVNNLDEESKSKLDVLNMQISPFILRRRKKDVLKSLPPKIENNIYLDLNNEQKKIYLDELDKTKREMDEIIRTEGFLKARFKILSLLTRLRQICISPKIVYDDYNGDSVKIDELLKMIEVMIYENHKILIFTSFLGAIDIVKKNLLSRNIKYYIIDGSVSSIERQKRVDEFNNSLEPCVFLISLKAGGTGLNLTSSDIVVHLDMWWNPQVEAQATDRAHRIGQKKSVQVIKFICKGTIEERILELQDKKKKLSDTLIEGELRSTDLTQNITEEEFRKLLSYSEE